MFTEQELSIIKEARSSGFYQVKNWQQLFDIHNRNIDILKTPRDTKPGPQYQHGCGSCRLKVWEVFIKYLRENGH